MFADSELPEESRGRGRRLVRGVADSIGRLLRVLLVPDRTVPVEVAAGRYRLAIAFTLVSALLAAWAIGSRLDFGPAVLAQNAGKAPAPAHTAASDEPPAEIKSDREIHDEIEKRTAVARVKLGLGAGLVTPAEIGLLAVVLLVLGRFVGGRPTLRTSLAAAAQSSLPWAVRSLVAAAAAIRQGVVLPRESHSLVTLGLGPPDNPLLARLVAGVDLFTLWSVVLLGFGFAASARIRRTKSFLAVAIGFVLYLLITRIIAGGPAPGPHPGPS